MEKLSVKLYDSSFQPNSSCGTGSTGKAPNHIKWYTGFDYRKISVFTDTHLHRVDESDSKYKIGWMVEPKAIRPDMYVYMSRPEIYNKFDYICTHDIDMLKLSPKFRFVPLAGHWIVDTDIAIHTKTKNVSIIASKKRYTSGHCLRHEIVQSYSNKIDGLYGNGYHYLHNKIEGLKDFRFHIVVENMRQEYWFTEKLIDAFLTGCIPVYWGCPSIGKFFNMDGMIIINERNFCDIINDLTPEYYASKLDAIKDNFERAKYYMFPEDIMFNTLLKDLC